LHNSGKASVLDEHSKDARSSAQQQEDFTEVLEGQNQHNSYLSTV